MKNFILLLPLFIASFFITNCNTLKGHRGVSENIEEAKTREVFVCEYELSDTSQINPQVPLAVEEIWMEHNWIYPDDLDKSIVIDGYKIIIELSKESFVNYGKTWIMMIGEEEILPTYQGVTHISQEEMFSDSVRINIYKLKEPFHFTNPKEIVKGQTLGSFTLAKKQ